MGSHPQHDHSGGHVLAVVDSIDQSDARADHLAKDSEIQSGRNGRGRNSDNPEPGDDTALSTHKCFQTNPLHAAIPPRWHFCWYENSRGSEIPLENSVMSGGY